MSTKKRGRGQPPHKPTKESTGKVSAMAAVGIPQEDIARVIGIDKKTLTKHYREVLDTSATKADAAVGGALYKNALGGDTSAQIWWSKARMRWKESKEEQRRYVDKDGNDLHAKDREILKNMGINID